MKIAVHQPNYLPWIGYMDKLDQVDTFVLLDTAMYTRTEFINRNKVKTPDGWKWLSVPVKGSRKPINEAIINNSENWRENHWSIIEKNYKKTPYWKDYYKSFEEIYSKEWEKLIDLNIVLLKHINGLLGIETEMIRESDFNKDFGTKVERIINIVKEMNGDIYLSGMGAKKYNDDALFEEKNIKLIYQKFEHPIYPQRWGEFEKYMSIIDMLFNCGPKTMDLIRDGRKK